MDILLPELLVQALTQCPQPELACCERACRCIPSEARCRIREEQRPALSTLVDLVFAERGDCETREGECGAYVGVE